MGLKFGFAALPSFDGWKPDIQANYGGSGRKTGLIGPDGTRYMVKFAKKQAPRSDLSTSYVNNVISEHIASRILDILGYPVHETALGTLNGEVVVVCRNFIPPDGVLIEFDKFLRRRYATHGFDRLPDISQIYEILETDPELSVQSDRFKACYWERFVGDALIGNFDRHMGDFGYLIEADGSVSASPIYDNGGALYHELSEQKMREVLMKRVRLSPKAALKINGKEASHYDVMSSGIYSELTDAVVSLTPRIRESMPAVREFIDGCGFLSDVRRDFYKFVLAESMRLILEPAYSRCVSRKFGPDAGNGFNSDAGFEDC